MAARDALSFADHFSSVSSGYAQFRPRYPAALFAWLATLPPHAERALDAGAGTGQASIGLRSHFRSVVAAEPSVAQLASVNGGSLHLVAATGEALPIAARSIDLITVAQALHWFDLPRFYAEVRRVARPEAVIAVWSYAVLRLPSELRVVVDRFYWETLSGFWPEERRHVDNGYAELAFPFEAMITPEFVMQDEWSFDHLLGYIATWSAVTRLRASEGDAAVNELASALKAAWGARSHHTIQWPLTLRVARVH